MRTRWASLVLSAALMIGGAVASPAILNAVQTSDNEAFQVQITELENRVVGLEARVSQLEEGPVDASGNASTSRSEGTHTLSGTFSIFYRSGQTTPEGEACKGRDSTGNTDWSILRKGTRLTVFDGSGEVLATGAMQEGRTVHKTGKSDGQELSWTSCVFAFEITRIADREFYRIEMAGLDGSIDLSKDELEEMDWTLTLG